MSERRTMESVADQEEPVPRPRVLVVDDELHIVDFLTLGLTRAGYDVQSAPDGETALRLADELQPDVVILDVMLPGIDGMQVCERLRSRSDVPILLLTARDRLDDRVNGLDRGADDYLCKPFGFAELAARVRALLRRRGIPQGASLQVGDITLDVLTREVRRGGRSISLTVREYDLLLFFMRHPGQVLTRTQILDAVWGYDFYGDDNVVEVYVRYLRIKLRDQPPALLQTVRGVGYILKSATGGRDEAS